MKYTYQKFEEDAEVWSKLTYEKGLAVYEDELRKMGMSFDKEVRKNTEATLKKMRRYFSLMRGGSVMGLEKIDGVEDKNLVIYSELFHNIDEGVSFSPAYFVYKIVEKYNAVTKEKGGYDFNIERGYVCRGLRTLASFFRELCLQDKLQKELGVTIETGAKQDTDEHTDLKLKYKGNTFKENEFMIWSYQLNRDGVANDSTVEKIRGKRGRNKEEGIPNGIIVLCPFDASKGYENVYGWYMYTDEYVRRVAKLIREYNPNSPIDNYCDVIRNSSDDDVKKYLKDVHILLKND